jgi:alpha-ribazole phosphatase
MIWLLRHTPVQVAPGICYGRTDLELADTAACDIARSVADLPAGIPVIASPARRCVALARAIDPGFTTDPRLLELDFGAWEGLAWDDVPRAALDVWAADPWGFAPPGGESGAALLARVRAFWDDTPARPLIIVSHGGPLRLLRQLAEGRAPDILEKPPALGATIRIGYTPPLACPPLT